MSQSRIDSFFTVRSEETLSDELEDKSTEPMKEDEPDKLSAISHMYPDPAKLSRTSDDSLKMTVLQNNREWAKTFEFKSM